MKLRIGCELRTIDIWEKHGAALAHKHGESIWWEDIGQHILKILEKEAKNYAKIQRKND